MEQKGNAIVTALIAVAVIVIIIIIIVTGKKKDAMTPADQTPVVEQTAPVTDGTVPVVAPVDGAMVAPQADASVTSTAPVPAN